MKKSLIVPALSSDMVSLRKGKKNLNRLFVVLALSVAFILVAWGVIKPFTSSLPATTSNTAAIPAQFIAGEMSGGIRSAGMAVPVAGANFKVAPVFDAAGALVSNPTGMLLNSRPLGSLAIPIPASIYRQEILGGVRSSGPAVPMTGWNFKIAPVFDATGALVSNPTGMLMNSHPLGSLAISILAQYIAEEMSIGFRSGGTAVPVTGANFKVAPVFDAAGAIVSDPTGTILSGIEE